jgi:hypothetical protein
MADGEVKYLDTDEHGGPDVLKDMLTDGAMSVRADRVTNAELLKLIAGRDVSTLADNMAASEVKSWLVTIADGEVQAADGDNASAAESVKYALDDSGDPFTCIRVERVTADELLKLIADREQPEKDAA